MANSELPQEHPYVLDPIMQEMVGATEILPPHSEITADNPFARNMQRSWLGGLKTFSIIATHPKRGRLLRETDWEPQEYFFSLGEVAGLLSMGYADTIREARSILQVGEQADDGTRQFRFTKPELLQLMVGALSLEGTKTQDTEDEPEEEFNFPNSELAIKPRSEAERKLADFRKARFEKGQAKVEKEIDERNARLAEYYSDSAK